MMVLSKTALEVGSALLKFGIRLEQGDTNPWESALVLLSI